MESWKVGKYEEKKRQCIDIPMHQKKINKLWH